MDCQTFPADGMIPTATTSLRDRAVRVQLGHVREGQELRIGKVVGFFSFFSFLLGQHGKEMLTIPGNPR